MSRSIGIMQGRLVPRYQNRYQAFPIDYWQAEFHIAKEIGLQKIEFILDHNDAEKSPLLTDHGIAQIKNTIKETGVEVKSICADYFMIAPFHSKDQSESEAMAARLLKRASELGVVDVVIPCVDSSSLKSEEHKKQFAESLFKLIPVAQKHGIYLNLETDLGPQDFKKFVEQFDSSTVKINYDIGNSSGIGYDPTEELEAYGQWVSDLHIKDRQLKGTTVMLGTGNANFDAVFTQLRKVGFQGNIIMQASRAEKYEDEIARVKAQLEFTRKYVDKYLP